MPKRGRKSLIPDEPEAKVAKIDDQDNADYSLVLNALKECHLPGRVCQLYTQCLPFALKTYASERHQYQETIAESVAKVFSERESLLKTANEGAESENSGFQELEMQTKDAAEASKEHLNAALSSESAAKEHRNECNKKIKEALKEVEDAQTRLQNVSATAETHITEREAIVKTLEDLWEPLKEFDASVGANTRERTKAIQRLIQAIGPDALPASLQSALPFALKMKPTDRTSFGQETIEHARKAIDRRTEDLAARSVDDEKKKEEAAAKVAECQAKVQSLQEDEGKAGERSEEASTARHQADQTAKALQKKVDALGSLKAEISKKLKKTASDIEAFRSVLEQFSKLQDHDKAPPVLEEAPADVVCEPTTETVAEEINQETTVPDAAAE